MIYFTFDQGKISYIKVKMFNMSMYVSYSIPNRAYTKRRQLKSGQKKYA